MYNQKPLLGTLINWAHPLSKGLIGAWPFNENSGNKVFDLSLNSNHGTFGAGTAAPTWILGKTGPVLDFDGINDHVDCGDISNEPISQISVSMWIYPKDTGSTRQYLVQKNVDADFSDGWTIQYINNDIYFAVNSLNSGGAAFDVFATDVWHHFVLTFDNADVSPKIYVNGISQSITDYTDITGQLLDSSNNLEIGRVGTGSYPGHFNGIIDEVMIYNRILSASDTKLLYYNPYCMFAQPMEVELMYAAPPVGAIMNQFQRTNLGADLYDGVLIT